MVERRLSEMGTADGGALRKVELQAGLIAAHCAERGLLTTGSADFHGPDHPIFSRFRAFELHGLEPRLGPIGA